MEEFTMKEKSFRFPEAGTLVVRALDEGGWFISKLQWSGVEVVGDDSSHLAAAWEVNLNGRRFTPHLPGVSAQGCRESNDGDAPVLIFPNEVAGLASLEMELKIDREKPLFWQRIRVTNTSDDPVHLERMNFAQLKLGEAFFQSARIKSFYASREADSPVAPLGVDDPAIVLHLVDEQKGLLVASLAPGLLRRFSPGKYLNIGYTNGETRFETVLNPGESFESDWAVFCFYENSPTDSSYWLIQNRLRPRPLASPLTYCSWIPFMRDINESRIASQIGLAAGLGFEIFLVDDGWQNRCGDWDADPLKFPGGLSALSGFALGRGMDLGLWIGLNVVHPDSLVVKEHPDWLLRGESGAPVYTEVAEGRMLLCCLDSGFGDWILEKITAQVRQWNLRYLKIDFPLVQDVYFQPPILCHCQAHAHRTPHSYTLNAYRRLMGICDCLHARFPGLILDLTFEIWGAFHAIDYSMVQSADVTWTSNLVDSIDFPSKAPTDARRLIAPRAQLFPAHHLLTGNLRCDSFDHKESIRAALEGYPCLLGNLAALDRAKADFIKGAFARYKMGRVPFS
jgi:alpha-galactosidase